METDIWDNSRTVVVSGVPDVLPVSRMIDKLTIHFLSRRRSDGGDVDVVRYPTGVDGVAFVAFDAAGDAERVLRKEQQILADDEFPSDYVLTVFPFTQDVYFYVPSAVVDLSAFGDGQAPLIQSLRSAHRSLRFRPVPQQNGATVEGPFAAVKALREDLIRRAGRLKSPVSAQTAAAKLRETPLNPGVISHHEFVTSVKHSAAKAKLQPASSNSLSPRRQTAGEAAQSLPSNSKSQNAFTRQKVPFGGLAVASFSDTDSDEEEPRAQLRLQTSPERRTGPSKAGTRRVLGEEVSAGIRSSLSGPDPLFAKQHEEDTGPERASTPKIRRANRSGSGYSAESDRSSSAVTAKLLRIRREEEDISNIDALSAVRPQHPDDHCIWVDSHTFRYIEKFNKEEFNRCTRGLDVSVEFDKGNDFVRVSLTEPRTSKSTSRIPQALKDLRRLVELQTSTLRVHQIRLDDGDRTDRRKLIQICDEATVLFRQVLYMLEDSCLTFVGPSTTSHIVYRRVKDGIAKLKDKSLRV